LTSTSSFFAIGMSGIYYHVVSVLTHAGYPTHWAGLVFGTSWVISALGSLAFGAMALRQRTTRVLATALLSCVCGTLCLLGVGQAQFGVACVLVFVTLWGASANSVNQLIPVILAERFGSRKLGALVGVQSLIMGIASAGAPVVTGLLYDHFSDYRLAIYLSAAAMVLSFITLSLIKAPQVVNTTSKPEIQKCI
jgi:OFA family oxalate/formate antiporter-like MFS transporter